MRMHPNHDDALAGATHEPDDAVAPNVSTVARDPNQAVRSPLDPMRRVWDLAARVAPVDSTVLISGESGVGKERMARWLHQASPRRDGPFIAVNCGAFSDSLLESELFGHVRGAFTGATADRAGVFEAAHHGTLFLDEIGEMSPAMQVRLLRVLQEREVRRVGETRTRRVDARLVTATNRVLPTEVQRGSFRADLYYRLRVVELVIPPLRERPDELEHLVRTLLPTIAARLGRPTRECSAEAWAALRGYRWPGNIRELEHALERACVVAEGAFIERDDLPDSLHDVVGSRLATGIADRERHHVEMVLAHLGGDRRRAAAVLGLSPSTLKRRLRGAMRPRVLREQRSPE
jgi:two-component system, NtrC family, response regulator HydG